MKFAWIIYLLALLASCSDNKANSYHNKLKASLEPQSKYDTIEVRAGLRNSYLFDKMNYKVLTALDGDTTMEKATSNILLVTASDSRFNRIRGGEFKKCSARISHDTIYVTIGYGINMGIDIKVVGSKFHAQPYYDSHVVNSVKHPVLIKNQRLILDKRKYSVGDSIFGDLHLRAKEGDSNWYADGLFRAKIKN